MIIAPPHPDEALRQFTLDCLNLLDTAADEYLDTLVRVARSAFGVETVLISLIDRDRQWFKARTGMSLSETSRDIAFCSHTILQRHSLVVPDTLDDPRFLSNPLVTAPPYIRLYAGHPIRVNGFPIGTLCLLHPEPRQLSDAERSMLVDLASLAEWHVLHRVQSTHIRTLYQTLDAERHRAMTDPLTQAWNRQGLEYFGQALEKAALANDTKVGVLYGDLDHFKSVNDRHGHAVGDQAIVQTARRLKATLRADDILVRLGGEEFLILVLVNQREELAQLARRARQAIVETPLLCAGVSLSMTISLGVTLKMRDETLAQAIHRADSALYRAKANGRNCIELG
ncbi:sensor domain-containing diguanylate cyclase [Stutzerimonas stutzeri]